MRTKNDVKDAAPQQEEGASVQELAPEGGATSAAIEGEPLVDQTATRAETLKRPANDRRPLALLGGGLAVAVTAFAIATFASKEPHAKLRVSPPKATRGQAAMERSKGSVTPVMDSVAKPQSTETNGQLTPADIRRTKSPASVNASPTTPTSSTHPTATLASVPTFESTQQHWEEPKPYGQASGSNDNPVSVTQQPNGLKEASLVFIRKSEQVPKALAPEYTSGRVAPELEFLPGTRIQARLETQVSSAVTTPVVAVIQYTYSFGDRGAIPAGARVFGQLQQADRSGFVAIKFNEIELSNGFREKIEAIGTSLELGPIRGTVSGKNTGRNFLVRTASGIGAIAAMMVGNNNSSAFSEDDLIRQRVAENVGNAGDTEIMDLAVTSRIVVSVSADTPIYIVFIKRQEPVAPSKAAATGQKIAP